MDTPPSLDHAYDFFAAETIHGLAEAPGNMNGWIEEDVPLGGEMGEPMEIRGGAEEARLDLLFGDDDDDEGPSSTTPMTLFPVGQPFPDMTHGTFMPPSVIDDLCVRMGNLEYGHGVLLKKMGTVSDAQVADNISIREIWPRVTTVEGQVQVMVSQAEHVGHEVIVRLSQQVQTLQTLLHGAELQNQQLRTRLAEMKSRESTLMSYMLWMEERLVVLEKKLPGPPPRPHYSYYLPIYDLIS
nr:hypothetical protein [Tanacetum cinerariifolium]